MSACSATTEDKVKLFDEVCSLIDSIPVPDENGLRRPLPNEDEVYEKIGENLRALGLICDINNEEIVSLIISLEKEINDEEKEKLIKEISIINNSFPTSMKIKKVYIYQNDLPVNTSMKILKYQIVDEYLKNAVENNLNDYLSGSASNYLTKVFHPKIMG